MELQSSKMYEFTHSYWLPVIYNNVVKPSLSKIVDLRRCYPLLISGVVMVHGFQSPVNTPVTQP